MRDFFPGSARTKRLLSIVLIALVFVVLLINEAQRVALAPSTREEGSGWIWWYASYAFIAFLFLCVGSIVWLYGYSRQRAVSSILFCFCGLMMFAFGTLSGANIGDAVMSAIGSSCSALAVFFVLLLLLRFPRDEFALGQEKRGRTRRRLLILALVVLAALCLVTVTRVLAVYLFSVLPPPLVDVLGLAYYSGAGIAIVLIIIQSARHTASVRIKQQMRLFFAGTLLSFIPILVLTIIPTLLHLKVGIDGTRSMISLVLFPTSLVYSILRYELLLFDMYIRRIVTWIVGGVGLALFGYLIFSLATVLEQGNLSLVIAGLVTASVLGAPLVWGGAHLLTERFFFPETLYFRELLSHVRQIQEPFDLELATHQLHMDVAMTLKAPASTIFVLNEETHTFELIAPPKDEGRIDQAHSLLLQELETVLSPLPGEAGRVMVKAPLVAALTSASRPIFLGEAEVVEERSSGLARYLHTDTSLQARGSLLAPIRTIQHKLVGILLVASRSDQQYAGPDLEVLQQLTDRAATAIETARLYKLVTRQQAQSTQELLQAYEQQRQLSERKDQFIINVSHELRTPLSEVMGYLDLLAASRDQTLDPEMQALFVQRASHGTDELLHLVETVLQATTLNHIAATPKWEALVLADLVREELDHLDPRVAHEYWFEQSIAQDLLVWADAQSLRQVLRNLLSNALKYSPKQTTVTVSASACTSASPGAPRLCICVKDEGPGISPTDMPLLFGKFVRLDTDLSGSIRGTGLGLYISKQLVEAMGGRIWVESAGVPGAGSTFAFTLNLPQGAADPQEKILVSSRKG